MHLNLTCTGVGGDSVYNGVDKFMLLVFNLLHTSTGKVDLVPEISLSCG